MWGFASICVLWLNKCLISSAYCIFGVIMLIDTSDDSNLNANHHSSHSSTQHSKAQQHKGGVAPTGPAPAPASVFTTASAVTPLSAIGKISDYDPLNEQPRNSPYSARQNQTVIYTSDRGAGSFIILILFLHHYCFIILIIIYCQYCFLYK